jgi:hypothetical protein
MRWGGPTVGVHTGEFGKKKSDDDESLCGLVVCACKQNLGHPVHYT